MTAFPSPRRQLRRNAVPWLLAVLLAGISGCASDSYPADLTYPPRSDPILTEALITEPTATDRPGELAQILSIYLDDADKRKVFDPSGLAPAARAARAMASLMAPVPPF